MSSRSSVREQDSLEDCALVPVHEIMQVLPVVSHEMRTPLTTISALASLMLADKGGELNPLQRDFLTSIQMSARHLNRIAEHILDVYLAEVGQFEMHWEFVDITQIILTAVADLGPMAAKVRVHTPNPDGADLPGVMGDRRRLERALVSILVAAIKCSSEAGRVDVGVLQVGDELNLSVEAGENGELAQDGRPSPATTGSARSPRPRPKGCGAAVSQFGLGLRAAELTAQQHGGRILIKNPGGGETAFYLCLPIPNCR
ncbi:MAG: HAMP domain-containing histidine kinase [Chloroflexi bacterium]|nr:HAMP domain-containing histidine kinase [Chloroflexota bacterium]